MPDKNAAGDDAASLPRPTVRTPKSVGQLEKAVRAYARTHGLAEGRVRDWVSYMALGGQLEATSQSSN